jgi:hypothetical protein
LEEYQIKLDRYALLAAIVEKQFLDGWRPVALLVLPVVLTTHGQFCPGAIELQEWLVEKYRLRLLLEGPREDGEEPEDLRPHGTLSARAARLAADCDDPGHLRNPQCRRAPEGFQAQDHSCCPSPEQAGTSQPRLGLHS